MMQGIDSTRSVRPIARCARLFVRLALLPAVLMVVPGCDRGVTDPEHGEPAQLAIHDRATGDLLANLPVGGTQWEGSLPDLLPGQEIAVNTIFRDEDGDEITLGGEFTAGARLADDAPEGIVALEPHGDHVDIEALDPGTTQIVFQLMHGGHSDWDAAPITITVVQP